MDQQNQPSDQQPKTEYVCEGSCGAHVSEEEYNAGKQTCGTEGCTHMGQPLKKVGGEDQSPPQNPPTMGGSQPGM